MKTANNVIQRAADRDIRRALLELANNEQTVFALRSFLDSLGITVFEYPDGIHRIALMDKTPERMGITRKLSEFYTSKGAAYAAALELLPDIGKVSLVGEDRQLEWRKENDDE